MILLPLFLSLCALAVRLNPALSVSFSLLILTLMNLGLFFKLWAMEDVAHRMYLSTTHRLRERSEARSDYFLFLCAHESFLFDSSPVIDSDCIGTLIAQKAEALVWVERGKGLVFLHFFFVCVA